MKTMLTIYGETPLDAWLRAYKFLMGCNHKEDFGLVINISQAKVYDEFWMRKFNAREIDKKFPSVYQDADVIFPDWEKWAHLVPEEFFLKFIHKYKTSTVKPFCDFPNWGSYFLRLTDSMHLHHNSVLHCIKALNTWGANCRSIFTFHITSMDHDKIQPQGNCCLQYLELVQDQPGQLSFCVAYRAHDYFVKALGNWIGISRLLTFICHHTGFKPGGILDMDGRAYISGKPYAQDLLLKMGEKKFKEEMKCMYQKN